MEFLDAERTKPGGKKVVWKTSEDVLTDNADEEGVTAAPERRMKKKNANGLGNYSFRMVKQKGSDRKKRKCRPIRGAEKRKSWINVLTKGR